MKTKSARIKQSKYLAILLTLSVMLINGCTLNNTSNIPSDFLFIMDVNSAGDFEGCINQSQVIKSGKIKLSNAELEGLWDAINQNNFFNLTDDYRMSMGFSYAFIMVKADGRQHIVDNIGMEVAEIRAIVEATDAVMPEAINLVYREGFLP